LYPSSLGSKTCRPQPPLSGDHRLLRQDEAITGRIRSIVQTQITQVVLAARRS
jgi:hypothetical protein